MDHPCGPGPWTTLWTRSMDHPCGPPLIFKRKSKCRMGTGYKLTAGTKTQNNEMNLNKIFIYKPSDHRQRKLTSVHDRLLNGREHAKSRMYWTISTQSLPQLNFLSELVSFPSAFKKFYAESPLTWHFKQRKNRLFWLALATSETDQSEAAVPTRLVNIATRSDRRRLDVIFLFKT